jgi:ubiquinone/menaquinone biosynthesis C-methylase UbiE
MSHHDYLLGHSDHEHDRLQSQADLFAPLTEDFFRRAELAPGMNILDIGAGAGDVSIMAAQFVGPSGSVVGVERAAESVARANARVRRLGLDNIRFVEGDLATLQLDRQFDAMVGRLIVLYLPDRERVMKRLLEFVRPGGIVALQEMDMTMAKTEPDLALFRETRDVIVATTRRAGFEPDMGTKLPPFFRCLGLRPRALMSARVESGPDSPAYKYLEETIRSVLPVAEKLGVTTAAATDVDTLGERLKHQLTSEDAVFVMPPLTGAWARR